ncbi:MAG: PQQ-binding-like beta-propeller repeat protein, partial [Thermoplasmatales archaeon]|nr:PQQ-binding-like beta-propeller repeat protein [Thermoplasmatales archaeon]
MRLNKIANKFIAICTVLLLIFSFNFSFNVTAGIVKLDGDGIAYDMLGDNSSITLENCTYDSMDGSVVLKYAPLSIVYDHNNKPDNVGAWYDDKGIIPGGDIFTFLSTITNPNLMKAYEFTSLTQIDAQDSQYLETKSRTRRQPPDSYPPLHLFEIKIDEDIEHLDTFRVNWWPGPYVDDAYVDKIIMYMWSYGDYISRWNKIGELEYTLDNINNDSIGSIEDADNYISEDGTISFLLVGDPITGAEDPVILSTDYVSVSLTTIAGFNSDGFVISDVINPSTFYGWESVRWESSKPTTNSYVTLQITDAAGNPLSDDELDGNSDGFSTSLIDLSSIGSSRSEIRIKAILHSEKYDITPRFYNWVVLWQTTDGFFDRFNYDFRIDKSSGLKIDGGEVTVSEFYSEWPIFGKNPANTRSYAGLDVQYKGNKTYWQTYIDNDIGGYFRSPIMYDGKVYIGSNDKKIYAFNATYDPTKDDSKYPPSDVSPDKYYIETAVAVENEYVIVGTSEPNNKSKIYALNNTNLSHELWEYTISGDNTICYTAAPTISDGKVYVTSWSGKFALQPTFYNLYSKLNELLGYTLLDNKLIALDITSGKELWDPVNLPAGSLSTPAVDNGLIFVGCDNIDGASAFAFDEDTGDEIWNASIGSVGRASPVVADGQHEKIVVYVVREQNPSSFKGTDKIVALNAEDGSMLWNLTIGNQSTLVRSSALKLKNFSNIIGTSQPAATPAVYDNTVYVASADGNLYALDLNTGEEKWVFTEAASSISYHAASPVVVEDTVYLLSQGAYLYSLETSNGEIKEEYQIDYDTDLFIGLNYGSPIVTDGLVIVSIMDWYIIGQEFPGLYFGHLMCLGEHTNNSIGSIYSIPIHVQSGNWWDEFNADFTNTTENTITFSILDKDGNLIIDGLNGAHNNISSITQDSIQLCGEFNIGNYSDTHPVLNNWGISWTDETGDP